MNPIVGIGELLWDVYPDGRKVAGGAPFNFAFHCHQLGHRAAIVSRVGDDEFGMELSERVRQSGVLTDFIQHDKTHPTGTVQVKLDAAGVPSYTITENVAWDNIKWNAGLDEALEQTDVVCFGSLALRHSASRKTILEFIDSDKSFELCVFDFNIRMPHSPDRDTLRRAIRAANWLKRSEDDLRILGVPLDDIEREWMLGTESRIEPKARITTFGRNGCEVDATDGQRFRVAGVAARVVDTVGAGDAFTAAMVCMHLEGRPLRECARFANHYAARVCEHVGATPRIDRREVEAAAFGC